MCVISFDDRILTNFRYSFMTTSKVLMTIKKPSNAWLSYLFDLIETNLEHSNHSFGATPSLGEVLVEFSLSHCS